MQHRRINRFRTPPCTARRPLALTARNRPVLLASVCALTLLAACATASSALAAAKFTYESARSEALGTFNEPRTLTFDAAGNLYVADPAHAGGAVIDKFDEENALVAELGSGLLSSIFSRGVAVNDETGHVYVPVADSSRDDELLAMNATGEELSRWNGANTPAKSFGANFFLYDAVDNSGGPTKGDVYVLSSENNGGEVAVLEPQGEDKEEGKYVRSLEVPPGGFNFTDRDAAAVNDSSGAEAGVVYVTDPGHKVIDRFSAAGVLESQLTGPSPSENFNAPTGVAVEAETGNVWVADVSARAVYEFGPSGTLLATITEAGGERLGEPASVAVRSSGPRKGEVYITDLEKHRIEVFGLEVAEKPVLSEAGVSQLTGDSALLSAQVNPHGASSTYTLEYGRCETAETCALAPYQVAGEGSLGSEEDFSPHTVSAQVTGLTQSTTYHFRVRAQNAKGQSVGEEVIFTTQGTGGELVLPDDRMWELVSPPDKHGGTISGISIGVIEAAARGGAISYMANAPIEERAQGSAGFGVQVLSGRGAGGWSSSVIASPNGRATGNGLGTTPEYRFFNEGLSEAIVQPFGLFDPEVSAEASEQTPYLRTLAGCTSNCYRPLVSAKPGFANVPGGTHFGEELLCEEENGKFLTTGTVCGPLFLGATGDLAHAVLSSKALLTQGAPREELYEWSAGNLQLISVLPESEGEELPVPAGEAKLGYEFGEPTGSARRAISNDGSRIFWSTRSGPGQTKALYMRDTALGRTLQLDKAETACAEEGQCESGGGRFQIASADGSRAFFTDTHKLTKDSGASEGGSGKTERSDLYECRISVSAGKPVCTLTDLTPETGGEKADVQGNVLGAGEDGEGLYFVAKGILGAAQNTRGEQPVTGQPNLYVRKDARTSFVAGLSAGDVTDWSEPPENQPTRVSPNGRFLAFMSQNPQSGYDNHDAISGQLDAEIFLYDAESGRTVCASCDPTGQRPTGIEYDKLETGNKSLATAREQWPQEQWVAALVPQATRAIDGNGSIYQSRYLSNSGRLFFNALGGLVPQDVNGVGDVYEHEPLGLKDSEGRVLCETSSSTYDPHSAGCLALISSGTSSRESQFLDASESGGDVFFLTNSKLSPQDVDSSEDVYDAHACSTASPCIPPPPVAPPACVTEASCKAAPTPQPSIFGAPASATFSGPGNLVAPLVVTKPKSAAQIRAEKLTKGLKACRTKRNRHKRAACERAAHKKYGAKPAKASNQRRTK
jgi:DNA-binding beta-propeller fold protein YncE